MRIAVPLDENKKDVCVAFARAPFFLMQDTAVDAAEVLENPAAQAQGGAGLKAAQFLADRQVDVLITVRCGENAAEVLKAAEIEIYKSEGSDAADNIERYEAGRLSKLEHFHAGFHGVQ